MTCFLVREIFNWCSPRTFKFHVLSTFRLHSFKADPAKALDSLTERTLDCLCTTWPNWACCCPSYRSSLARPHHECRRTQVSRRGPSEDTAILELLGEGEREGKANYVKWVLLRRCRRGTIPINIISFYAFTASSISQIKVNRIEGLVIILFCFLHFYVLAKATSREAEGEDAKERKRKKPARLTSCLTFTFEIWMLLKPVRRRKKENLLLLSIFRLNWNCVKYSLRVARRRLWTRRWELRKHGFSGCRHWNFYRSV